MSKDDKIIQPIDASLDDVVSSIMSDTGATSKDSKNNKIAADSLVLGTKPVQFELFHVEAQKEIDGVEMGVLESGVPYLTGRGLERMCGLGHGPFHRLTSNWQDEKSKPRGLQITKLLQENGYFGDDLFIRAEFGGREITAFTEPVCMAFLEYFAFVSDEPRKEAIKAFRTLARSKFREFIYDAVGYSPEIKVLDSWKHFHDRTDMTMDAAPFGYFGVFREIAIMIVPMIRNGVLISDKVVPDISVGGFWSEYWEKNNLSQKYGERTRYNHEYPDYYKQSKSNPQQAYAYPNEALGEFRSWLQKHYITNKFPKYLLGQTKGGSVALDVANKTLNAFGVPALPQPKTKKLN